MTYTSNSSYNSYTGNWSKDKKNGHGTLTFKSGTSYTGNFLNDKYHGQGTMTYLTANGSKDSG